jgi:hypothetical protein
MIKFKEDIVARNPNKLPTKHLVLLLRIARNLVNKMEVLM